MLLIVNFKNKLKFSRGKINISSKINNQWQSPVRTHQRAKWFLQWSTNWKKVRTICCQVQMFLYKMFLHWMSHIKCLCIKCLFIECFYIKYFCIKCFCIKCLCIECLCIECFCIKWFPVSNQISYWSKLKIKEAKYHLNVGR
jgi:hypothetical protein